MKRKKHLKEPKKQVHMNLKFKKVLSTHPITISKITVKWFQQQLQNFLEQCVTYERYPLKNKQTRELC
jgi:hypothetical protein